MNNRHLLFVVKSEIEWNNWKYRKSYEYEI